MTNQNREQYKIYKNVFDEFTLSTLYKLTSQGHFEELVSPLMIGKESNVFIAETADESYVIVKIYRLASCNFNKMYSYIKSDPRFMEIRNQRRQVIFKWVQREYRNLLIARECINVPMPIVFSKNVLVMESIGGDTPARQIKDDIPTDPKSFFKQIIESIILLGRAGIVHADLSEFNILNLRQKPYLIDFSQGTSIKDNNADEYMQRDVENIIRFFAKIGHREDLLKTMEKIKKEINKKPINKKR